MKQTQLLTGSAGLPFADTAAAPANAADVAHISKRQLC